MGISDRRRLPTKRTSTRPSGHLRTTSAKDRSFFLQRGASAKDGPERNKLASLATGPYRVVKASAKNVVTINASGIDDTVSRDRVVEAPTPSEELPIIVDDRTPAERQHEERPRAVAMKASAAGTKASTQEEEGSDGDEYVIDRLVAYDPELNRIRTGWFGYGLKKTHSKGQTACRFTNCAPVSESAKGESPKRSYDALPEHLRNAARH